MPTLPHPIRRSLSIASALALGAATLVACGYERGDVVDPTSWDRHPERLAGQATVASACFEAAAYAVPDDAVPTGLLALDVAFGNPCRRAHTLDLGAIEVTDADGQRWAPVDPDGHLRTAAVLAGGASGREILLFAPVTHSGSAELCIASAGGDASDARSCLAKIPGSDRFCVDLRALASGTSAPMCWGSDAPKVGHRVTIIEAEVPE